MKSGIYFLSKMREARSDRQYRAQHLWVEVDAHAELAGALDVSPCACV